MRSSFSMPLLYHAYVYLEFLILACTIYILAPVLPFESGIVARKCMITNKRAICVECNKKGHNILRRVDDESKLDEEQMVKLLDFMRGENNNG